MKKKTVRITEEEYNKLKQGYDTYASAQKKYREKHKDYYKEYHRKWQQDNKEKVSQYQKEWKAKKKQVDNEKRQGKVEGEAK